MSTTTGLTASYTSPTNTQVFSDTVPSVSATCSVEEKTAFVAAVRASASKMQNDINAMLTKRMEEDKAQEAAIAGSQARTSAKDEEREEEVYGEEDVGDE